MEKKLLSICIPTYNGGDNLRISLNSIVESQFDRNDVEVIVSDNGSNDYTKNILNEFSGIEGIRIFRNSVNLGFNGNCKLLIDKYAKGSYCWIIGDDDFIDKDAISILCSFLRTNKPDFVSIGFRTQTIEEYNQFQLFREQIIESYKGDYFSSIDYNATVGNILGTFMSTQVFLLAPVRAFDKSVIEDNTWSDFKNVFPNSYIMTEVFGNSINCYCIRTELLTAISHPKSWDDKFYHILTVILPDYYRYCIIKAKSSSCLYKNKRVISRSITEQNLLLLKKCKFGSIKWKYFFRPLFIVDAIDLLLFKK